MSREIAGVSASLSGMQGVLDAQVNSSFDDIQKGWDRSTERQRLNALMGLDAWGEIRQVATGAASATDTAWQSAFDNIQGYADGLVSGAQSALDGLMPGGQSDPNAPGANGPFENIFRAADVAVNGDQSQWAAKLGLDQATAQRIVADFQAGLFTEEVKALVDVPALITQVQTKALADQLTQKFSADVAAAAGVGKPIVESLMGIDGTTVIGADGAVDAVSSAVGGQWAGKSKDFQKLGKDFIGGLIAGLNTAKGDLVKSTEDIANAMLAAMRRTLGIHSPSRVMYGLGQLAAEGFGMGIRSGVSLAGAASSGMAQQAISNVSNQTWNRSDTVVVRDAAAMMVYMQDQRDGYLSGLMRG